ncbi:HAD family hydrolase [Oxalicibacterium faecigallinarum]|nr:HAD-IA family hydrolase [Oxalicibacterium faecigallinarum]
MTLRKPRAVLFDLDGTLADTAPDLAGAVNMLRTARGLTPTDYALLRPVASAGARGLIGAAFGITPQDAEYPSLRDQFLENYATHIAVHSHLFAEVPALLQGLEQQSITWGIVTNKVTYLTEKLVPQIGLAQAACVICGDTTAHPKPHPAPLLEAANRIHLPPESCWYVGDDLRDIQAGHAAGMTTIAAGWGYCGATPTVSWGADITIDSPYQLLDLIAQASAA